MAAVLGACCLGAPSLAQAASPAPAHASHAMVASAEALATDVGVRTLQAGGNAVDAAVAVGFALAVTFPQAGNLGGGGFAVVRMKDGTVYALDFREKAPSAARHDMYLDASGKPDDRLSREGFLASGVPGTIAGLAELHRKLGRLPLRTLIEPARRLAADGFPIPYSLESSLREDAILLGKFPESRSLFLRDGRFYVEGERFVQRDLARTLGAIQKGGPESFYNGSISQEIVRTVSAGGSLLTLDDLKSYAPVWREPVRVSYHGYDLVSMPPPSSGGIILAQVLNQIGKEDLPGMGFHSSRAIHVVAEAMRRSYRDRARLLGDPDFVKIDTPRLASREYAACLRATVDSERATPSADLDALLQESTETTHYCVVDEAGDAVAITYTLNGSYGCGRMAAGMLFNNEMDDFAAAPGHPNMYGLVGSEANSIQPRKRMLSSMAPTIVAKDGRLVGMVGSPGGSTIPTTVIQVLMNLIDYGFDIQEAIDLPRFHHQYLPDQIRIEKTCLTADGTAALERMGHRVVISAQSWGNAQGIWYDAARHLWLGGSDSRGSGKAAGY